VGGRGVEVRRPLGRLKYSFFYGNIILKWIFEKWDGWTRIGSIWLRTGTSDGLF
jgi:hypothetical protein